MTVDARRFEAEVARALDAVGAGAGASALDATADPGGACAALDALAERARLVVRGGTELGEGTAELGPEPRDPVWIGLTRGVSTVRVAPMRLAEGGQADERVVREVVVARADEPCCDAASCATKKTRATATLELAPKEGEVDRLLVAEALSLDADAAVGPARAVAGRLARALGVPLRDGDASVEADAVEAAPAPEPLASTPAPGAALARYGIRREGARVVLRDYASTGPQAGVRSKRIVGTVTALAALGLWVETVHLARTGGLVTSEALGLAAVAALFTLTAYAFFAVARYSNLYAAKSEPLVAVGRDRLIVRPWVSRAGAVDRRPEGRFGAGIPIGEIRSMTLKQRDGAHVVALDTDHGPFDVLATDREELATMLVGALQRSAESAAHPSKGASARQRFRARAQGVAQGRAAT